MMHVSRSAHSIFLRLSPGDSLLDALGAHLREGGVATGTLTGHGVLEHVELRTFAPDTRTLGAARSIRGAIHALSVFGTIGLSEGAPQLTVRAVLSRESDSGIETLSGVVTSARVVAFEAMVVSAQDLALALSHDARAGVPLIASPGSATASGPHAASESPKPPATGAWADAVATSGAQPPLRAIPPTSNALPARPPAKPAFMDDVEQPLPEAGDEVQHFAFGRCEVIKSDGDRLHLKVGKEGRIREIALEMLKVTQLDEDPTVRPRHYRLDRRL